MIKKFGPACPEAPEHIMPPIQPLLSVGSVNGRNGDIVLNSNDVDITCAFDFLGTKATVAEVIALQETAHAGDVWHCTADSKFYFFPGNGAAPIPFANGGTSGEPSAYIVDASVANKTLTLSKNNQGTLSTVTFTDTDTTYLAGSNVTISDAHVISATDTTYEAGTGLQLTSGAFSIDPQVTATKLDLTAKQDTIDDLTTIRTGAGLGATAVQPAAITDMATKTWVGEQGFLTEHQSLAAYRTSAAQDVIDATKQNVLTAGTNITIADNVISAADTTYTAGNGLTLTTGQFAIDTQVTATTSALQQGLATKQDTITFNTAYDPSSNKAATMADINAAIADAIAGNY